MAKITLDLLRHQAQFIQDTKTRDLALVGGRGSGKSFAICAKACVMSMYQPGFIGAMLAPTGVMASRILIPGMQDALKTLGLNYEIQKTLRRFDIQVGRSVSQVYILSAENIRDSLGLNLAWFGIDECDTIPPEIADEAWKKLSAALRAGDPEYRQKFAVSTPEGISSFMYQHWNSEIQEAINTLSKNPSDPVALAVVNNRRLIKARSTDNPFLTTDFFDDLRSQFSPEYLAAYINGEFVNLQGRLVYSAYSQSNHTHLTLNDINENEPLHIGVDFNVDGGSAIACVIRGRDVFALDEILGTYDTQEQAKEIVSRWSGFRHKVLYPDASGSARKSSAPCSDHDILRREGLSLRARGANPSVRDRVNSVNTLFCDGNQVRRLFVNPRTCKGLDKSLQTQTWDKNGQPLKNVRIGLKDTKNTYIDGPLDALGYFVFSEFPIRTQVSKIRAGT